MVLIIHLMKLILLKKEISKATFLTNDGAKDIDINDENFVENVR